MWYHNKPIFRSPYSKKENHTPSASPCTVQDFNTHMTLKRQHLSDIQSTPNLSNPPAVLTAYQWPFAASGISLSLPTFFTAGVQLWDLRFPVQHPKSLSSQLFGVISVGFEHGLQPCCGCREKLSTFALWKITSVRCFQIAFASGFTRSVSQTPDNSHYQVVVSSAPLLICLVDATSKSVFDLRCSGTTYNHS